MRKIRLSAGAAVVAAAIVATTFAFTVAPASAATCLDCPSGTGGGGGGGGTGSGSGSYGAGTGASSGWFDVPEASATVDTGINVDSNDSVQITADTAYQIWAGVLFTGNNGPAGWTGYQATDPKFPLHGDTDRFGHIIRPYSLLAEIDNSTAPNGTPLYQVGDGFTTNVAAGSGSHRVFLKINDDAPRNGSGKFRAYVQVTRNP
jgi:hypothetical protein